MSSGQEPGHTSLEVIDVVGPDEARRAVECGGLFCFIGADAASGWLPKDVGRDPAGFVLTDRHLPADAWAGVDDRPPLPYESSVPASSRPVTPGTGPPAGRLGGGAGAISSAHRYLAGLPSSRQP